jgi:hypothetical protein
MHFRHSEPQAEPGIQQQLFSYFPVIARLDRAIQ